MVDARNRVQSDVSDTDNYCVLCYNVIEFFAMGSCDHKNTCQKCSLRLRLILDDNKCSICKTELDEIIVTNNKSLSWTEFDKKFRKKAI